MKPKPISPAVYQKILNNQQSDEIDEVITLSFMSDTALTIYFRITWSHLHEGYIAEYVSPDQMPLILDEIGRATTLDFFETEFKITKVLGIQTEEAYEDQERRLRPFFPSIVDVQ